MKAKVYLSSGLIIDIDNVTQDEAADLRCGLDSRTDENRIYVGEWVFDGKAVDAVRIIEEVEA